MEDSQISNMDKSLDNHQRATDLDEVLVQPEMFKASLRVGESLGKMNACCLCTSEKKGFDAGCCDRRSADHGTRQTFSRYHETDVENRNVEHYGSLSRISITSVDGEDIDGRCVSDMLGGDCVGQVAVTGRRCGVDITHLCDEDEDTQLRVTYRRESPCSADSLPSPDRSGPYNENYHHLKDDSLITGTYSSDETDSISNTDYEGETLTSGNKSKSVPSSPDCYTPIGRYDTVTSTGLLPIFSRKCAKRPSNINLKTQFTSIKCEWDKVSSEIDGSRRIAIIAEILSMIDKNLPERLFIWEAPEKDQCKGRDDGDEASPCGWPSELGCVHLAHLTGSKHSEAPSTDLYDSVAGSRLIKSQLQCDGSPGPVCDGESAEDERVTGRTLSVSTSSEPRVVNRKECDGSPGQVCDGESAEDERVTGRKLSVSASSEPRTHSREECDGSPGLGSDGACAEDELVTGSTLPVCVTSSTEVRVDSTEDARLCNAGHTMLGVSGEQLTESRLSDISSADDMSVDSRGNGETPTFHEHLTTSTFSNTTSVDPSQTSSSDMSVDGKDDETQDTHKYGSLSSIRSGVDPILTESSDMSVDSKQEGKTPASHEIFSDTRSVVRGLTGSSDVSVHSKESETSISHDTLNGSTLSDTAGEHPSLTASSDMSADSKDSETSISHDTLNGSTLSDTAGEHPSLTASSDMSVDSKDSETSISHDTLNGSTLSDTAGVDPSLTASSDVSVHSKESETSISHDTLNGSTLSDTAGEDPSLTASSDVSVDSKDSETSISHDTLNGSTLSDTAGEDPSLTASSDVSVDSKDSETSISHDTLNGSTLSDTAGEDPSLTTSSDVSVDSKDSETSISHDTLNGSTLSDTAGEDPSLTASSDMSVDSKDSEASISHDTLNGSTLSDTAGEDPSLTASSDMSVDSKEGDERSYDSGHGVSSGEDETITIDRGLSVPADRNMDNKKDGGGPDGTSFWDCEGHLSCTRPSKTRTVDQSRTHAGDMVADNMAHKELLRTQRTSSGEEGELSDSVQSEAAVGVPGQPVSSDRSCDSAVDGDSPPCHEPLTDVTSSESVIVEEKLAVCSDITGGSRQDGDTFCQPLTDTSSETAVIEENLSACRQNSHEPLTDATSSETVILEEKLAVCCDIIVGSRQNCYIPSCREPSTDIAVFVADSLNESSDVCVASRPEGDSSLVEPASVETMTDITFSEPGIVASRQSACSCTGVITGEDEATDGPLTEVTSQAPAVAPSLDGRPNVDTPATDEPLAEMPDTHADVTSEMSDTPADVTSEMPDTPADVTSEMPDTPADVTSEMSDTRADVTSEMPDTPADVTSEMPKTPANVTSEMSDTPADVTSEMPDTLAEVTSEMSDTPADVTSEMSDTPADVTSEMPDTLAEVTTEMSDTPADVTSEMLKTPADVTSEMSDTPADVTSEMSDTPADVTSEMPKTPANVTSKMSHTPADVTSEMSDTPADVTSEMPDTLAEVTSEMSDTPADVTSEMLKTPADVTSEMSDTPADVTAEMSDTPADVTSEMPKTPANVTSEMSDTPADVTSEMSDTPADVTSEMSDTPADVTSEMPKTPANVTSEMSDTPASVTSEMPDTLADVTSEMPDTPVNVTSEMPDTSADVTSEMPDTPANVTSEMPDTPANVTSEMPDTLADVTPEMPDTHVNVTSEMPDTPANVTSEMPDTPANVTSEMPDTPANVTSEMPDTLADVTSEMPDTHVNVTSEMPDTAADITSETPDTPADVTSEMPDTPASCEMNVNIQAGENRNCSDVELPGNRKSDTTVEDLDVTTSSAQNVSSDDKTTQTDDEQLPGNRKSDTTAEDLDETTSQNVSSDDRTTESGDEQLLGNRKSDTTVEDLDETTSQNVSSDERTTESGDEQLLGNRKSDTTVEDLAETTSQNVSSDDRTTESGDEQLLGNIKSDTTVEDLDETTSQNVSSDDRTTQFGDEQLPGNRKSDTTVEDLDETTSENVSSDDRTTQSGDEQLPGNRKSDTTVEDLDETTSQNVSSDDRTTQFGDEQLPGNRKSDTTVEDLDETTSQNVSSDDRTTESGDEQLLGNRKSDTTAEDLDETTSQNVSSDDRTTQFGDEQLPGNRKSDTTVEDLDETTSQNVSSDDRTTESGDKQLLGNRKSDTTVEDLDETTSQNVSSDERTTHTGDKETNAPVEDLDITMPLNVRSDDSTTHNGTDYFHTTPGKDDKCRDDQRSNSTADDDGTDRNMDRDDTACDDTLSTNIMAHPHKIASDSMNVKSRKEESGSDGQMGTADPGGTASGEEDVRCTKGERLEDVEQLSGGFGDVDRTASGEEDVTCTKGERLEDVKQLSGGFGDVDRTASGEVDVTCTKGERLEDVEQLSGVVGDVDRTASGEVDVKCTKGERLEAAGQVSVMMGDPHRIASVEVDESSLKEEERLSVDPLSCNGQPDTGDSGVTDSSDMTVDSQLSDLSSLTPLTSPEETKVGNHGDTECNCHPTQIDKSPDQPEAYEAYPGTNLAQRTPAHRAPVLCHAETQTENISPLTAEPIRLANIESDRRDDVVDSDLSQSHDSQEHGELSCEDGGSVSIQCPDDLEGFNTCSPLYDPPQHLDTPQTGGTEKQEMSPWDQPQHLDTPQTGGTEKQDKSHDKQLGQSPQARPMKYSDENIPKLEDSMVGGNGQQRPKTICLQDPHHPSEHIGISSVRDEEQEQHSNSTGDRRKPASFACTPTRDDKLSTRNISGPGSDCQHLYEESAVSSVMEGHGEQVHHNCERLRKDDVARRSSPIPGTSALTRDDEQLVRNINSPGSDRQHLYEDSDIGSGYGSPMDVRCFNESLAENFNRIEERENSLRHRDKSGGGYDVSERLGCSRDPGNHGQLHPSGVTVTSGAYQDVKMCDDGVPPNHDMTSDKEYSCIQSASHSVTIDSNMSEACSSGEKHVLYNPHDETCASVVPNNPLDMNRYRHVELIEQPLNIMELRHSSQDRHISAPGSAFIPVGRNLTKKRHSSGSSISFSSNDQNHPRSRHSSGPCTSFYPVQHNVSVSKDSARRAFVPVEQATPKGRQFSGISVHALAEENDIRSNADPSFYRHHQHLDSGISSLSGSPIDVRKGDRQLATEHLDNVGHLYNYYRHPHNLDTQCYGGSDGESHSHDGDLEDMLEESQCGRKDELAGLEKQTNKHCSESSPRVSRKNANMIVPCPYVDNDNKAGDHSRSESQNVPSASQQNVPSALQQNVPSASQQNVPSAPQQNVPSALQQNVPSASQQNVPSALQLNVSSASQQNVSSASQQNVPSASQQNVPSALQQNVPSASQQNVPSALQQNVPSASQQNVPSASQQNVPSASQQNVPSASQQNVPSALQQTVQYDRTVEDPRRDYSHNGMDSVGSYDEPSVGIKTEIYECSRNSYISIGAVDSVPSGHMRHRQHFGDVDIHSVDASMHSVDASMHCVDRGMQSVNAGMQSVNASMQSVDEGMQSVDEGMQSVDEGMQSVDVGMHSVDEGMQSVDEGMHSVDEGMHSVDSKPEQNRKGCKQPPFQGNTVGIDRPDDEKADEPHYSSQYSPPTMTREQTQKPQVNQHHNPSHGPADAVNQASVPLGNTREKNDPVIRSRDQEQSVHQPQLVTHANDRSHTTLSGHIRGHKQSGCSAQSNSNSLPQSVVLLQQDNERRDVPCQTEDGYPGGPEQLQSEPNPEPADQVPSPSGHCEDKHVSVNSRAMLVTPGSRESREDYFSGNDRNRCPTDHREHDRDGKNCKELDGLEITPGQPGCESESVIAAHQQDSTCKSHFNEKPGQLDRERKHPREVNEFPDNSGEIEGFPNTNEVHSKPGQCQDSKETDGFTSKSDLSIKPGGCGGMTDRQQLDFNNHGETDVHENSQGQPAQVPDIIVGETCQPTSTESDGFSRVVDQLNEPDQCGNSDQRQRVLNIVSERGTDAAYAEPDHVIASPKPRRRRRTCSGNANTSTDRYEYEDVKSSREKINGIFFLPIESPRNSMLNIQENSSVGASSSCELASEEKQYEYEDVKSSREKINGIFFLPIESPRNSMLNIQENSSVGASSSSELTSEEKTVAGNSLDDLSHRPQQLCVTQDHAQSASNNEWDSHASRCLPHESLTQSGQGETPGEAKEGAEHDTEGEGVSVTGGQAEGGGEEGQPDSGQKESGQESGQEEPGQEGNCSAKMDRRTQRRRSSVDFLSDDGSIDEGRGQLVLVNRGGGYNQLPQGRRGSLPRGSKLIGGQMNGDSNYLNSYTHMHGAGNQFSVRAEVHDSQVAHYYGQQEAGQVSRVTHHHGNAMYKQIPRRPFSRAEYDSSISPKDYVEGHDSLYPMRDPSGIRDMDYRTSQEYNRSNSPVKASQAKAEASRRGVKSYDGPVSVQDPVDIMNSQDGGGQSEAKTASSSNQHSSSTNQHQASSHASSNHSHSAAANENQAQAQINGTVVEDRKNLRNLPLEEVIEKTKSIVGELGKLEEYHRGEGMRLQKMLGDFYWDYTSQRKQIGDAIAEAGYAEITIKMLKSLNTIGIFKNDEIWFPAYYTYNTTWNYSDTSDLLARNLAEADAVRLLSLNCSHKPYITNIHSKNVFYVMKASMSILHNIARNPNVKGFFKENKTAEVIMPFINMNDDMLRVLAMLTLAYIVEEEDNSKLIDETGTIKNVVMWIGKALDNPKRRFKGFTPQELTQGLDKLAVNDGNKLKIIEEGSIPLFMKMLLSDNDKEQSTTARCVWTLAFDKEVRKELLETENMMSTLEKLLENQHKDVKKNAQGALWVLTGKGDAPTDKTKGPPRGKNHIFISYSWNEQEKVLEIRDKLRAEGYIVWVDVDEMGGSTLQAMAEAVENAAVVLVCMSEKYKQSPNCRTEAEYTFQLRKDYIPLMMQKKYRPDGWLGMILGAKLFFDFSGKYPFEKSMSGMLKELRGRGKRSNVLQSQSTDQVDALESTTENRLVHAGNPHRNTHPGTELAIPQGHQPLTHNMSRDDVQRWLVTHQLDGSIAAFSQFDGRLLWQLREMKQEAPDYFYQCLEKKLSMNLIDMLRLASALDTLH